MSPAWVGSAWTPTIWVAWEASNAPHSWATSAAAGRSPGSFDSAFFRIRRNVAG